MFRFIFSLSCQSSPARNSISTEIQTTSARGIFFFLYFFYYYALFRLFIYFYMTLFHKRISCRFRLHVSCVLFASICSCLRLLHHFPCVQLLRKVKRIGLMVEQQAKKDEGKKRKEKSKQKEKKKKERMKKRWQRNSKNITLDSIRRDITKNAVFAQQKPSFNAATYIRRCQYNFSLSFAFFKCQTHETFVWYYCSSCNCDTLFYLSFSGAHCTR